MYSPVECQGENEMVRPACLLGFGSLTKYGTRRTAPRTLPGFCNRKASTGRATDNGRSSADVTVAAVSITGSQDVLASKVERLRSSPHLRWPNNRRAGNTGQSAIIAFRCIKESIVKIRI